MDTSAAGLEGKHVVITGASGGLGGAVLDGFLAAGAFCHLPERGAPKAEPAGSRVERVGGIDLKHEGQVTAFYASLPPLWASIHLAGGFAAAPLLETSLADFQHQLELNLVTAFLCCREAVRNMRKSGGGGRLVNVSSRAALVPAGGSVAYASSKAGLSMLTQCMGEELKADGILVNAVAPSIIDTPANRASMPKADFSRWPKAVELAQTITWLASPANRLTSGAVIPVYGRA